MDIPPSTVEFIGDVEERYKCIACRNVLQDPVQSWCGHRFCSPCIQTILDRDAEPKCPEDNELLKNEGIFKDKCAQKEILDLECACLKKSLGCIWTGKFSQLKPHKSECPFAEVKCLFEYLGCKAVLFRYQLAKHVERDCPFKTVKCPYCFTDVPEAKMKEHLEKCLKFPVKCPHGCDNSDILRGDLKEHAEFCPSVTVECSLSSAGCQHQGRRSSLEGHLNSSVAEHLSLFSKQMEKLTTKVKDLELQLQASREMNKAYETQLSKQSEALAVANQTLLSHQVRLAELEKHAEKQRDRVDELSHDVEVENAKKIKDTKAIIDDIVNRFILQEQRMDKLEAKSVEAELSRRNAEEAAQRHEQNLMQPTSRLGGGDRRLQQLEHSLTLHDIQLADQDLKIQILQTTSYDGSFLWKIDDYSRRFREAVEGKTISLYSPPFYTSRYGYKLCARVYLNGDGMGKGSFMSLFVVIMRGEYDGLLQWPFRQKVTMRLLAQEHVFDVVETFRPDPNSSSFQRPRSEMNIASGCPQFCLHAKLKSRGYLRDNSIFIKIIVDSADIPTI